MQICEAPTVCKCPDGHQDQYTEWHVLRSPKETTTWGQIYNQHNQLKKKETR